MLRVLVLLSYFCISAYSSGEFTVYHAPKSIEFKGNERLDSSLLKEVYSVALGQTTAKSSEWSGLYITDPFHLSEAIVTVAINGPINLDNSKGHHFPLNIDENESEVFGALEARIYEHNPDAQNNIVHIDLSYGLEAIEPYNFLHGIKHIEPEKNAYKHLKIGFQEDREFLYELNLLNAIIEKIKNGALQPSHTTSVFWFKFPGYKGVVDLHGENSAAAKEARTLLADSISRLQAAFVDIYDGKVLINTLTNDVRHLRFTRAVNSRDDSDQFSNLNLASTYSENFPVIFNIILWFGVAMMFSIIAISIAIGDMDPGRDSIIYRMTSTRMKKDN